MAYDASIAVLTLLALCVLFYGPWQEVCTDYARQVMFEKRDNLFDMAVNGELDFGSTEYRTIRTSLEKSIRYAHELTLPRFVLFQWLLNRTNLKNTESNLLVAVRSIKNDDVRLKVERLVSEAQLSMILMAMAKSPLTVLLFLASFIMIKFQKDSKRYIREASRPLAEMVQMEAEYINTDQQKPFFNFWRTS
jgi:hypothetical protein